MPSPSGSHARLRRDAVIGHLRGHPPGRSGRDPVAGRAHVPARATVGEGVARRARWSGRPARPACGSRSGGAGSPSVRGTGGEMPQRTGWLEKTVCSDGLIRTAHRRALAGPGSSGLPTRTCWTRPIRCAKRASQYHSVQYNSLRAKNIPAAGGVLPLSVRTGWGLPAGGSRSTGSRSASGGSSHAERVVLRRYGGRLAASGTTRLRPDRYSWKAEGEARGHLRTDTLYNARTARMFRPHKVIWIAANRVTVWSARKPGDG